MVVMGHNLAYLNEIDNCHEKQREKYEPGETCRDRQIPGNYAEKDHGSKKHHSDRANRSHKRQINGWLAV